MIRFHAALLTVLALSGAFEVLAQSSRAESSSEPPVALSLRPTPSPALVPPTLRGALDAFEARSGPGELASMEARQAFAPRLAGVALRAQAYESLARAERARAAYVQARAATALAQAVAPPQRLAAWRPASFEIASASGVAVFELRALGVEVRVLDIELRGGAAASFSLDAGSCAPVLAPGVGCVVLVEPVLVEPVLSDPVPQAVPEAVLVAELGSDDVRVPFDQRTARVSFSSGLHELTARVRHDARARRAAQLATARVASAPVRPPFALVGVSASRARFVALDTGLRWWAAPGALLGEGPWRVGEISANPPSVVLSAPGGGRFRLRP